MTSATTAARTASWPVTIALFSLSLPINALGNAVVATWVSFLVPTAMIVVATVVASVRAGGFVISYVGLGTLIAFLCQGSVTGWSDRHLFGWFTHQAVDAGQGASVEGTEGAKGMEG